MAAAQRLLFVVFFIGLVSVGDFSVWADCTLTSTGKTPLNDLGGNMYLGSKGGLYPDGGNTRPVSHEQAGLLIANGQIVPRNAAGDPDPDGKIVMISVGMSNTSQEFGSGSFAFKQRADSDPSKNPDLLIINCAMGGAAVEQWLDPSHQVWTNCQNRLASAGVTSMQVQVAWIKLAERASKLPDPSFPAHAQWHADRLSLVIQQLHDVFPMMRIGFMSSRTRAYTTVGLNPEPIAYEENFSVKWVIESQINGLPALNYDSSNGPVQAPLLVWGPYIWTDGEVPRSDGFTWLCKDVVADYTHPSPSGIAKVADQLLAFFKTDSLATPWFLRDSVVGQAPEVSIAMKVLPGESPLTVAFSADATDADGTIIDTVWTFGDGGYSTASDPTKIFPVAGEYTVRLTVTDDAGNAVTAQQPISVAGIPVGAVPAVSTWGAMIMALLIAAMAGVVFLPRRAVRKLPAAEFQD